MNNYSSACQHYKHREARGATFSLELVRSDGGMLSICRENCHFEHMYPRNKRREKCIDVAEDDNVRVNVLMKKVLHHFQLENIGPCIQIFRCQLFFEA